MTLLKSESLLFELFLLFIFSFLLWYANCCDFGTYLSEKYTTAHSQ